MLSPSTELKDRTTKFFTYQKIPSLMDYVLIAQDTPRIECFSRGEGDAWIIVKAEGLDGKIKLPSLDYTLELRQVYARVSFTDEAPPE